MIVYTFSTHRYSLLTHVFLHSFIHCNIPPLPFLPANSRSQFPLFAPLLTGMEALEQSLLSADMNNNHNSNNGGSPYHQQFQSLNQQQQQQQDGGGFRMPGQSSMRPQLPPRSPQVTHPIGQQHSASGQMGQPYGTPTRHRAVSLPPSMMQQQVK